MRREKKHHTRRGASSLPQLPPSIPNTNHVQQAVEGRDLDDRWPRAHLERTTSIGQFGHVALHGVTTFRLSWERRSSMASLAPYWYCFQSQEHNVPIYYPPKAIANHTKTKRVDKGENLSDFHRGPPSPPTSPKEKSLLISGRDRHQPTNHQSCIRSTSLWGSRGFFFFF